MAESYPQLWNSVANTNDKAEAVLALSKISTDKGGRDFIVSLGREEVQLCINVLDRGIVEPNLGPTEKLNFFFLLSRLAERHGRLPDRMMMTTKIEVLDEIPILGGVIGPITYEGCPVAVKIARYAFSWDLEKIKKRFYKEVVLWSALSHPNIVEFVGVQVDMKKHLFAAASKWMGHRNIMEFIRENHVNRPELLHGASKGLEYLHGVGLAHGNLRGANILVSNEPSPRPCLSDFDFITTVLDPTRDPPAASPLMGGMTHFTAPELLLSGDEKAEPTLQADIYSFGSLILQVLTGRVPFPSVYDTEVAHNVLLGKRPSKPENASVIGFSDSLWAFTERCWHTRGLRPNVREVVIYLGEATAGWDRLAPL